MSNTLINQSGISLGWVAFNATCPSAALKNKIFCPSGSIHLAKCMDLSTHPSNIPDCKWSKPTSSLIRIHWYMMYAKHVPFHPLFFHLTWFYFDPQMILNFLVHSKTHCLTFLAGPLLPQNKILNPFQTGILLGFWSFLEALTKHHI